MKLRSFLWLGAGLVLAAIVVYPLLLDRALRAGTGPKHIFGVSSDVGFLTEDVALSKARETLVLDGLNIAEWQVHPDGRTRSPDGRTDQFMARNSINSNAATLMFTSGTTKLVRFVSVELKGTNLTCQSSVGR